MVAAAFAVSGVVGRSFGAAHVGVGATRTQRRFGDAVIGHYVGRNPKLADGSYFFLTSYRSAGVDYPYYVAFASRGSFRHWRLILPMNSDGTPLAAYGLETPAGGSFGRWYLIGKEWSETVSGTSFKESQFFHVARFGLSGKVSWRPLGTGKRRAAFASASTGVMAMSPLYGSAYNFLFTANGGRKWRPQPPLIWPHDTLPGGRPALESIRWAEFVSPRRLLVDQAGGRVSMLKISGAGGLRVIWRHLLPTGWHLARQTSMGHLWCLRLGAPTKPEQRLTRDVATAVERLSLRTGKATGVWDLSQFSKRSLQFFSRAANLVPIHPGSRISILGYPVAPKFVVVGKYFVLECGWRGVTVGRLGGKHRIRYEYSLKVHRLFSAISGHAGTALLLVFPNLADVLNAATGKMHRADFDVTGTFPPPSSPGGVLNALGNRLSCLRRNMPSNDYYRLLRPFFNQRYLKAHNRIAVERAAVERLTEFHLKHHIPIIRPGDSTPSGDTRAR